MIDKPLLAAVITLLTISLVMDYSLSIYYITLHPGYGEYHFFIRQSGAVFVGFISMVILSKLNPDNKLTFIGLTLFFVFALIMVVMQFMPASLVNEIGGAKRWIYVGPVSVAPVEFFKVGFVFFLAWSFSRKLTDKSKMGYLDEINIFLPYLVVFAFAVIVIAIFQKDLGQVFVLGVTLTMMILFIGISFRFFLTLLFVALSALMVLVIVAPHRIERIKSWWSTVQNDILALFPNSEFAQSLQVSVTEKEPFQIANSLNAIHNGGLWGQGLGNGQFKLGYLSEVHTDFILAGITEELGFAGLVFVTLTMLFIVFRIFKIASKVQSPVYYLFSIGIGSIIAFSFILNAYGISGMTPIKGIAVPFLSYGGSHIVASCIAIGMILMISKKMPRDKYGKIL